MSKKSRRQREVQAYEKAGVDPPASRPFPGLDDAKRIQHELKRDAIARRRLFGRGPGTTISTKRRRA